MHEDRRRARRDALVVVHEEGQRIFVGHVQRRLARRVHGLGGGQDGDVDLVLVGHSRIPVPFPGILLLRLVALVRNVVDDADVGAVSNNSMELLDLSAFIVIAVGLCGSNKRRTTGSSGPASAEALRVASNKAPKRDSPARTSTISCCDVFRAASMVDAYVGT